MNSLAKALLPVGALLVAYVRAAVALDGFTLTGENWSYTPGDGGGTITGILSKPSTNGSLPAVVIGHGKGGTAAGFSLPKAHVMTNWGLVCIGPNYTHAGSGSTPDDEGWCPENDRRSRACLTILASLGYVDTNRVATYGNSMGAFATAGFCGSVGGRIRAAAITAGGCSGTTDTSFSSPAVQEVQGITAPFLMLHGTADTTVPPAQSATLQNILISNAVPNNRVLFDGVGHNLHSDRSDEVYALIRDWFTTWGVLSTSTSPATNNPGAACPGPFPRPRGLYVVDSQAGTNIAGVSMRDANMRDLPFLTGYALRPDWQTLEPAQNAFDFTIIDWNVRRLAALGQKLSVCLLITDPPWIAQTPGVTTWFDSDPRINRLRAVPWDPFLLARLDAFVTALAQHTIDGIPFNQHPVLEVVNLGIAGAKLAIRDPESVKLRDMPGYTRAALTDAIQRNLRAAVTNFPERFVQVGFWPITDYQASPALHETLRQTILAEFDGVVRPRVGFWMENLSASRPTPGQEPVDGRPATNWATALSWSQTNTWAGFQALTSWYKPFNGYDSQVTNATPADGLHYANTAYGTTYFELYVRDIDYAGYTAAFQQWHARLFPPEHIELARNGTALRLDWSGFPGGLYQVQTCTDLHSWSNLGAPILAATNALSQAVTGGGPSGFFRIRVLP